MNIFDRLIENKYFGQAAHGYISKLRPKLKVFQSAVHTAAFRRNAKAAGAGLVINGAGYISDVRCMSVGANVHIGEGHYFKTEGGLSIGDNCHLSRNITIYTVDHDIAGKALPYDDRLIPRAVTIGRNVWIGMDVCIAPGSVIGEGAVIGLGARVSGTVPPFSVVVSPKQRQVGERDIERYHALEASRAFGGRDGQPLVTSSNTVNGAALGRGLFFVVSTGRSGSATLAEVLNRHERCRCEHEPRHNMIRISTQWLHGELSEAQVRAELSANFNDCSVYPVSLVCGESDHKYGNLIPFLADLMPEAKFVWVIRDAEKVVASSVGRGWFDDYEYGYAAQPVRPEFSEPKWSEYRGNGHLAGVFSEEEWRGMSAFERNCWYWRFWNEKIESDLAQLPQNRWSFVRLEELSDSMGDLQQFLQLPGDRLEVTVENKARHDKVTRHSWSEQDKAAFTRWCEPGMEKWYSKSDR